jgi:hypothetical protein
VSTVTKGGVSVGDVVGDLAAEFPCWRIWRSRPRGMWWATRRGNVQYHDEPRRPGWGITVGGVATLPELACLLAAQRDLDNPDLPLDDDAWVLTRRARRLDEHRRGVPGVAEGVGVVA